MFNDSLMLQLGLFGSSISFILSTNILTLWYFAGIYLICLGILLLTKGGDIFVGFLWVIDLGVGLIFFIFMLHFSTFLHQKTNVDVYKKTLTILPATFTISSAFIFLNVQTSTSSLITLIKQTWFFLLSWYDFYLMLFKLSLANLILLREIYFYNNSLEFVLINFILMYGLVASVLLSFMIKKLFNTLLISQFVNFKNSKQANSIFFLRTQNFIKQQLTSSGTRIWVKIKNTSNRINDL